jgi:hypothetical protein
MNGLTFSTTLKHFAAFSLSSFIGDVVCCLRKIMEVVRIYGDAKYLRHACLFLCFFEIVWNERLIDKVYVICLILESQLIVYH